MSVTVQDIFDKARALLNIYTEEGVQIPQEDYIDLQTKSIPIIDMGIKELYKVGKLYKVFEFDNKPTPNLLGTQFDIVDFTGNEQYYPNEAGVAGAKAYYFEVNRDTAVVTIEENQGGSWVIIETPTITTGITTLTGFKGTLTTQNNTNKVRIKFSGTTHYRHANRCLYEYPFALTDIPEYSPWYTKTMPSDFRTIDAVIEEYPELQYQNGTNYKLEGFRTLKVNYFYEGKLRVIYKPVPTTITAITDNIEIDDITAQALVYYVAARLAPFKKKELAQFFEDKFQELKQEATRDNLTSATQIIDVYGGGE